MKNRILSVITVVIFVFGITNLTHAATTNSAVVTTLTNISNINKIEVRGNVEVFISDGQTDEVKVYNKYYSETALVQSQNGVLRITSYKAEKLVVWITAKDLRSIVAYDNASIESFGKLSKIEFDVELHNNASANLNLDADAANVTVADHANANLAGKANDFNLTRNFASSVNRFNLVAEHYTDNRIGNGTSTEMVDEDIISL